MDVEPTTDDFYKIAVEEIPLIDVRAPIEFHAGAFPQTINLPILDDEDRHLVGICYKDRGKDEAMKLAEERVSGEKRNRRTCAWVEYLKSVKNCCIYCFRGGMRSQTVQQWVHETGGFVPKRLEGGYKAFRRYLLTALQPEKINATPVILGGRTGGGKTILLRKLSNSVDLEGIAHHRGSTFGGHISPQPTQIDFENRLAYALLQHQHREYKYLLLEDEGSFIGARYIPHDLAAFFKRDSMVLLECGIERRLEITHQEYIGEAQLEYQSIHGPEQGLHKWYDYMVNRIHRIRKRLGGLRHKRVLTLLENGHQHQLSTGESELHKHWIELLLTEYYDPMYDYQIKKSGRKIEFQGDFTAVYDYLGSLESSGQKRKIRHDL